MSISFSSWTVFSRSSEKNKVFRSKLLKYSVQKYKVYYMKIKNYIHIKPWATGFSWASSLSGKTGFSGFPTFPRFSDK